MNATALAIDLKMARHYLDALAPDGDWTFQTFDDSEERKAKNQKIGALQRIIHCGGGRFERVAPELARLNEKGAGIFLMVNRGDMRGRCAENVVALRAVFIDGDGIPFPATFHRYPDLFVCRNELRWHVYWKVPADMPLATFENAQRRLAAFYRSDSKLTDLCRVMRLPGFIHRKGEPAQVRLEHPYHG
jgi:hypothetical protein